MPKYLLCSPEGLFLIPVGDIDFLAGGLIFQHHAVTGHALRHLVTGFQVKLEGY